MPFGLHRRGVLDDDGADVKRLPREDKRPTVREGLCARDSANVIKTRDSAPIEQRKTAEDEGRGEGRGGRVYTYIHVLKKTIRNR